MFCCVMLLIICIVERGGARKQSIARMYLVLSVSSLVPSINYVTSKGPQHAGW